jgi:hypothetical protein
VVAFSADLWTEIKPNNNYSQRALQIFIVIRKYVAFSMGNSGFILLLISLPFHAGSHQQQI